MRREERFSRAIATVEELEARGIKFHSFKEPMIDSSEDGSPNMGRDLLRAILPVIATFESKRKPERVRVAMREIREGRRKTRSGRPPGRPRRLTEEKVGEVLRLRESGLPWASVAQRVGLPSGTCRSVLSRARTGGFRPVATPGETPSSLPPA